MQKCDLCLNRLQERQNPVCVAACPTRALEVAPLEKLKERDGNSREADGFVYSDKVRPSVVFKTKGS
jgi:anaerobic dimethyl sulfoxide reductase subunit B (iron-sulfur subunit)